MASKLSPIFRYKVRGKSMEPHLKEGSSVYVSRLAYLFVDPEPNEIIAINHPTENFPVIKRVKHVTDEGHIFVVGDNAENSTDSRHYGAVEPKHVIGKVMLK